MECRHDFRNIWPGRATTWKVIYILGQRKVLTSAICKVGKLAVLASLILIRLGLVRSPGEIVIVASELDEWLAVKRSEIKA